MGTGTDDADMATRSVRGRGEAPTAQEVRLITCEWTSLGVCAPPGVESLTRLRRGRRNARASSEPGRSGAEIVRVDAGNDDEAGGPDGGAVQALEQVNKCKQRATRECFHYTKVGP